MLDPGVGGRFFVELDSYAIALCPCSRAWILSYSMGLILDARIHAFFLSMSAALDCVDALPANSSLGMS